MKTKSSPSRYRYCISRLSTLATSTLVPALKVRSTTLPDSTFFSLVRTNAPPLPGLTCWNSTTPQSWPSMFSVMPFFRSLVVATVVISCGANRARPRPGSQDEQVPGGRGEQLRRSRRACLSSTGASPDDESVLDPDPAPAGQVDAGLDGNGNPVHESTCPSVSHHRRFVHLQADAMAEAVLEVRAVPGRLDHVPGRAVHVAHVGARHRGQDPGELRSGDELVDL